MAAAAFETATKELNQQIGLSTDGSQFLTFNLGEELYGVDILRVQEIKGYTAVTKIPNTPPDIKGVLNLRGTIVPIVELRTKFDMPMIDYTMFTVIIVVVVKEKIMGLVVDSVSDVLNIDKKDIQAPPQFGAKMDVSFLSGIGKSGDKLVALLDMDRLLSDEDRQNESVAPAAA
ncbi:MAG: purine-binding chemotaxis protein [Candidatus Nitrospira kreftii]|uniref:Chemotaxis protein CheW n=1 Tax=Candidatus Nitrospira kreftii TaxID=2652173 RepID=A0A7S8FFD1_9BACT|nr:MAG: purine-binding chemotaxis protein [Candidatus Nitrospira kreftii]